MTTFDLKYADDKKSKKAMGSYVIKKEDPDPSNMGG
jgi:hypothetical protein